MRYPTALAVLFFLLAPLQQPAHAQADDLLIAPLAAAVKAKIGPRVVVRCATGDILAFDGDAVDSLTGRNLLLKKKVLFGKVAGTPAPLDSLDRWAVTELLELALSQAKAGVVKAGDLTLEITSSKMPEACEVAELLGPFPPSEGLDKPVLLTRAGISGDAIGWAVWENPKPRLNTKGAACSLQLVTAEWGKPLTPELTAAFQDELTTRTRDKAPADSSRANTLRVLLLGWVKPTEGAMVGFGQLSVSAIQAAYLVTNADGKLVVKGRASRMIGTKVEKDLRDLASYIPCH